MSAEILKNVKKFGINPKKRLGQNFLLEEDICKKIAKCSLEKEKVAQDTVVLEIGAGPGGLTKSILELNPKKLYSVEIDKRAVVLLNEMATNYPNLEVIQGDALKLKIKDIIKDIANEKVSIIANLPYNIGTQLLVNWMRELHQIDSLVLMLQKEVVDRIVSDKGSKDYGRLSILVQSLCGAEKCFDVQSEYFFPEPKVTSSVVRITPKKERIPNEVLFTLEKITNLAFNQRRKMIRSSLKSIILPDYINQSDRPEDLSVEDFINIARCNVGNL
jgi:16S rRNA (adenine1518-N6/adenine1519-N6)-dimethyltransferase